jgi:DNA-binding NarL/FixJ family response regulator
MIKFLLIDDHPLILNGLTSIIKNIPNVIITGQAQNVASALGLINSHEIDMVITDLYIGNDTQNGIFLTREIKKRFPTIKVLMLSQETTNGYILREAYQAGIDGYVSKNSSFEELTTAIQTLHKGKKYFDHGILERIAEVSQEDIKPLTAKEKEILTLIAKGFSRQDICHKSRNISENTYDSHLRHIKEKINVKTMSELIQKALQLGLIELDEFE